MLESTQRTIQKFHLISPDSTLVVGVSGGADSLALMHILYTLQSTLRYRIHVASLDHGLRGEQGHPGQTHQDNQARPESCCVRPATRGVDAWHTCR